MAFRRSREYRSGDCKGGCEDTPRRRHGVSVSDPVPMRGSEVAASFLFDLEGLEEGLEVALSEALAAPAADDLEEQGGAVLQRLGEELTTSVPGPCIEIFTDLSADLSAVFCTA